ncbi:MAG: enoyl-CoA hydratase/isomerase family protein [Bacillota bacterium]
MIFPIEMREGLALVTINRPPVNAINPEFVAELLALCERINSDDAIRAVLFRSEIPGRYIAGADLAGVLQEESDLPLPERIRRVNQEWRRAFYALEALPVPTVAAISGHCFGGGLEFTLACDYRFMLDDGKAMVGLTEINLGLFPGAGGTYRLPRVVGLARAKDMIYRGRRLLAPEAKAIGLVHDAWGPEEFERQVLAFAQDLANGPTQALKAAKAAIMAGLSDRREADRLEEDGFVHIVQTEDAREGLTAFWEKRPPQFKGR